MSLSFYQYMPDFSRSEVRQQDQSADEPKLGLDHSNRPLHIVVADNDDNQTIIITAYEPDPALWESDFKKKRKE